MKAKWCIAILALAVGCGQTVAVTATAHGYKTTRVVATRVTNKLFGQMVSFEFPLNIYDGDRIEVSQFMEQHGGSVIEGGGYPGSLALVEFEDVKDAASANKKIIAILPALTELMGNLNNPAYMKRFKSTYEKWDRANNPQWPDTTPPDKTNPYWEFNNNLNSNGTPYHKVEVSPGKWQWKVDEEAQKQLYEQEARRAGLYSALQSRVLTAGEFKEALAYGDYLNVPSNTPYMPEAKASEFRQAFEIQERLRRAAHEKTEVAQ